MKPEVAEEDQICLIMEDNPHHYTGYDISDIRNNSPEVNVTGDNNALVRGWFMSWAHYKPASSGAVGMVAVILMPDGSIVYRDPKRVKFILAK